MKSSHQLSSKDLGIDLSSRAESQLFRWLLACLLFGKPIQQAIARQAYLTLTDAGITSLQKLLKINWDSLVTLLDEAHYVRYDFSTASKLLEVGLAIHDQYGSVHQLLESSNDSDELEKRLTALKGIGPTTAKIFIKDIAPIWFKAALAHDYESAQRAAVILNQQGYEAYIIGGAVRDLWLGLQPKDFDLVTSATPEQIIAIPDFGHARYKDTAQAYGVTRVLFDHRELEIATFRVDLEAHLGRQATKIAYADLEDDVLRRDFTVNALAFNPITNQIIDYVGGIDDLESKIIRFIGKPLDRIKEDPLRLLRAIRFKNHLGFSYYPQTTEAIAKAVADSYVEKIAVDRLRNELTNLLIHPSRHQAVLELDEFGILERVLPEVTAGKGTSQPPQYHAEGNVWQHELLILDYLPLNPSKQLVWAALLHDIGKQVTATGPRSASERIHFNRHYAIGSEMAKTILRRLKFSNHDVKDISWIIYNHMGIDDLPAMRPSHQQRMLGHSSFADLLQLHRADAAASWRPGQRHDLKPKFPDIEHLWHAYQAKAPSLQQPSLKRDLGIDGNWLLSHFGDEFNLAGSPVIGKVLRELNDWYRDESIKNEAAYVAKARQLLRTTKTG